MGETMRERIAITLSMVDPDERGLPNGYGMAEFYRMLAVHVLAEMREPTTEMLLACCAKAAEEQCRPITVNVTDAADFWQAMIDEASK